MPIIKSAIKRAKQATVRRERNIATKKEVKQATKTFQAKPTADSLAKAHSAIDTAVKKNVLNPHTAARRKSSLSKVAKTAGVKLAPAKKSATTTKTAKAPATVAKKPAVAKATKAPAKVAAKATAKPAVQKPATVAKKPAVAKATKAPAAKKPAAKK